MAETAVSNVNFRKGNLRTFPATVKNTTGGEATLNEGSLLQFDNSDGTYIPYAGGVNKPVAIVSSDLTIGATSETSAAITVAGDVNGAALELPGSLALDDVPSSADGAGMVITPGGSNTGNGVAGAITQGLAAKVGTYTLTCTAEAGDAGTFGVVDPDGVALPDLTVAVAYDNGHFGVTIADGAEDFDTGDIFTVVSDILAEGSVRLMLKNTGIIAQDVIQMVS